jgi:hypothetical protein
VVYDASQNAVCDALVMPTLTRKNKGKSKKFLNISGLVNTINLLHERYPNLNAWVELVGANRMHGRVQGVTSMFNFGVMAGAIDTALTAAGIPFQKVPPSTWKPALGCNRDKDETLVRAGELIPAGVPYWTPKRLVRTKESCKGIAEAALIAYYGARLATQNSLRLAA